MDKQIDAKIDGLIHQVGIFAMEKQSVSVESVEKEFKVPKEFENSELLISNYHEYAPGLRPYEAVMLYYENNKYARYVNATIDN